MDPADAREKEEVTPTPAKALAAEKGGNGAAPAQTPDEVMRELKLYIGGGIAVLLLGLLFTVVRPMLQMAE